jgi:hypothetical protein
MVPKYDQEVSFSESLINAEQKLDSKNIYLNRK